MDRPDIKAVRAKAKSEGDEAIVSLCDELVSEIEWRERNGEQAMTYFKESQSRKIEIDVIRKESRRVLMLVRSYLRTLSLYGHKNPRTKHRRDVMAIAVMGEEGKILDKGSEL